MSKNTKEYPTSCTIKYLLWNIYKQGLSSFMHNLRPKTENCIKFY